MITLLVKENNPLTPNFYNDLINRLQFHRLTCPCGRSGCLSVHGYYKRSVRLPGGTEVFRICRVRCECCGHTHAILLSSMVPYSRISLTDHVSIIDNYLNGRSQDPVMDGCPLIDEGCCRYIIRCYLKHWHQKLLSGKAGISCIPHLVRSCFSCYSRQFMQIKCTPNILFSDTT